MCIFIFFIEKRPYLIQRGLPLFIYHDYTDYKLKDRANSRDKIERLHIITYSAHTTESLYIFVIMYLDAYLHINYICISNNISLLLYPSPFHPYENPIAITRLYSLYCSSITEYIGNCQSPYVINASDA